MSNDKVTVTCKEHGDFTIFPNNHTRKNGTSGCPVCGKTQTIQRNSATKLSHEEFVARAKAHHGERYEYVGVFSGWTRKIKILCREHGCFAQLAGNHMRGGGCPKCKNSKGARRVEKVLQEMDVVFIKEHTFDDCIGVSRPLRFDFWLPELNAVIEYDGEQHFRPVRFSPKMTIEEARQAFARVQTYDSMKNDYCNRNLIRLLRVKYNDRDIEGITRDFVLGRSPPL
jgi:hypothetical protein